MKIEFEILGDPMGKGRPKFSSAGKFVRTYTPKETENYENKVVFFYKKATEYYFDKNELEVNIVAYFKLNKEHYKKKVSTKPVKISYQVLSTQPRNLIATTLLKSYQIH